jgi:hypothetical protein
MNEDSDIGTIYALKIFDEAFKNVKPSKKYRKIMKKAGFKNDM